jgi:outer membrane protein TolC
LLGEVLQRNTELAALGAFAQAVASRPAQAGSFPDPKFAITGYLKTPETRVGPVQGRAMLSQRFPWFGRRGLRAEAETHSASAAEQRYEARRLELFTEARILYFEIAFLDRFAALARIDRDTLSHFEELARARYSSGVGLQQDAIRIQAEITRIETKLLEIAERRASAVASLNALRNRSDDTDIPSLDPPDQLDVDFDLGTLKMSASTKRSEVVAAAAETARTAARVELARKENKPDFTFALSYSVVDQRSDPAGRLLPPEDNGKDDFGLTVGFNIPIHRKRISAGINEALEHRRSAEQLQQDTLVRIHRDVEDLATRIPLIRNQLQLLEEVLVRQSEESLRSVEAAYGSGSLNALDLLDAERVLIEARTAAARSRADYAIAVALLEGAIAGPIPTSSHLEGSQP